MNTILDFFNSSWLQTVGYALIHSIWQGCVVLAFVQIVLNFIPIRSSNVRYLIASIGLLFIPALTIGTYIYISTTPAVSNYTVSANDPLLKLTAGETTSVTGYYFTELTSLVDAAIPGFLILWILGTAIFTLRIFSGLVYVRKLRQQSNLLEGEWSNHIQLLAKQLKINRWVSLAESGHIKVPIVVGYVKPLILVPIGICTSLSPEQLETIFLHELMHIRRQDYLTNLIQSFVEAIFFFNPMVWIISGIMKREREHCCDDAVVRFHGNVMDYARALTSLEEVRLSKPGLSLSLAEDKNQLLNRIKRLMEKSVKNYSGRERILPALLLVMGLICASWISIQTGKKEFSETATPNQTVASDTTKKDKKNKKLKTNSTNPTKEMAIKNDEGSDHDMVEKSDGQDKASLEEPETLDDYHFAIPPVPDIEAIIPPVPDIDFMMDALEVPAIAWRNEEDWKEFSKEFEEQFKEKFEHFYQTNEKDIQQMIDDVQQKVASRLDEDWVERMHGSANKHQALALNHAKQRERHQDLLSRQTEHFKNAEERMKRRQEEHALHMREFEKNHELFEKKMKHFEESTKRLEEELRSELIKDGYLGEDEQLTNMHWNNGRIEINGKKIKSQDEKKYNELHEQFFKTH